MRARVLICSVGILVAATLAAQDETSLAPAEADVILATLPAFTNTVPVTARIETEVDDLLGKRVEKGELLLQRPQRMLRKFTAPALKLWLLDGAQIQEYAAKSNTLYVKDFSQAPRALKLIQAACTGDLKALQGVFDVATFRGTQDGKVAYRFVLTRKADAEHSAPYKRIEARLMSDAPFFHQIEYEPEDGDKIVERYSRIALAPAVSERDFTLALPADVKRKQESVK